MRRNTLVASATYLTLALTLAACGDQSGGKALLPTAPPSLALASLSSNDFQQCANGTSGTASCDWISSVLNASKSAYVEGEVIPFRFAVHLTDGSGVAFNTLREREVTFEYGFEKSSTPHFNYDFLAKYNSSESQANVCSGPLPPVSTYCNANGTMKAPWSAENHSLTIPVPGTPSQVSSVWGINATVADARAAFELAGGKAEFDIWGGTITRFGPVTYTASGDDIVARFTVYFTANRRDVLLAWGAHFARGADWGTGFGASGQSGSPFHVKMVSVDGTGAGALGNNVSGGVVTLPSLSLAKTGTTAAVNAGDNVSYTVTVTNGGSGGTASGVTITDALPGAGTDWSIQNQSPADACSITGAPGSETLTCGPVSLAPGASLTATVTSATTAASCPSLSNTATATATGAQVTGSPTAAVVITVNCNPQLSIVKKTNGPGGSPSDNNGTPAPGTRVGPIIEVGDQVTWTYEVSNTGNVPLSNVAVTDDKVAGTSINCPGGTTTNPNVIPSLAVSATVTCTATGTATAGQYRNIGTATSGTTTATDPDAYFGVAPNLTIDKTPKNGSIVAGNTATFTIVVSNTGDGDAKNVALSDQLLASLTWAVGSSSGWSTTTPCSISSAKILTCGVATLSAGSSATVTVSANVPTGFVYQPPTANGTELEMDGNLVTNGGTDWATSGVSCVTTVVGCALDATGQMDNSFGNGTKEDTPVPSITAGSIPPNKSDLLRFYVTSNRVDKGQNGTTDVHDFIYLAWERVLDPQGTTNMDFEFNQSTQVSSNGQTPVRTPGDILIKYDLSRGGANLTMGFHRWVASGQCEASGAAPPCWGPAQSLAGSFRGQANLVSVVDPLAPQNPRTLSPLTFGEASIDLKTSGIFTTGQCTSFGRAYLKSRSSDSFTAAIKDFVAPLGVSITNCQPASIPNTASVTASNATGGSSSGLITVTVP